MSSFRGFATVRWLKYPISDGFRAAEELTHSRATLATQCALCLESTPPRVFTESVSPILGQGEQVTYKVDEIY